MEGKGEISIRDYFKSISKTQLSLESDSSSIEFPSFFDKEPVKVSVNVSQSLLHGNYLSVFFFFVIIFILIDVIEDF
jgi:hypothetical protein